MSELPEVEYKVQAMVSWSRGYINVGPPPEGWTTREQVTTSVGAISDDYIIHRRIVGTDEWQLMARASSR